ncbi:MAG: hypothetical protein HKL86_03040 [Acidimicrobiaceae bacterium]|nr:hypothetical protein [Acidimicrobiaceae bacterium]
MNRAISLEHIKQVSVIEDRVLRNLWVTQTYADLSGALGALLDRGTCNWCTFATWASFTVGGNMRGDALPSWLRQRVLLPDGLMGSDGSSSPGHDWNALRQLLDNPQSHHVLDVTRGLLGEMAINLSNGNTEVFVEIAPPASLFVEEFSAPSVDTASARAKVLDACDGAPEFEGVNRLRAGYSLWCDAMASQSATERSQLILAGSLQLGVHEQNHLQPVIASSMDMGINQAAARLSQSIAMHSHVLSSVEQGVDLALHPATRTIADLWDGIMTATLATITSPEGTMRLDHDVPAILGQPFDPPELSPTVVADLEVLLSRFERSRRPGRHSGARDWASFDDRMDFIANLFVSRHHFEPLYAAPFDDATLAAMLEDQLPASMTVQSA